MTAPAPNPAPRRDKRLGRIASLIVLLAGHASAHAQLGADATIVSNAMFRGRSISAGRPAATAALSYDHESGLYAGLSAGGLLTREGDARIFMVQEYAGFAHRMGPQLSLDLGILNTHYTRYWSNGRSAGYTEAYVGLTGKRLSARLHVSPDYLGAGWRTIYGGLDYLLVSDGRWDVGVHVGTLLWIAGGRPAGAHFAHYDWQIGAGRRIGRVQLRAAWAAGGPQADRYGGRQRPHGAPVLSLSTAF
jgi:uncharacterized protein (TIGR02001 family)